MTEQTLPRDIFTRLIKGDMNNPAVRQATEWLARIAEVSHLDPEMLAYPTTSILQAYEKQSGKPLLYMPVHSVFMMESLGPNPNASELEIAAALAQITKTVAWEAAKQGMGECYMPCSDGNVIRYAEHHGFTRMTFEERKTTPAEMDGEKEVTPEKTEVTLRDMPFLKLKTLR